MATTRLHLPSVIADAVERKIEKLLEIWHCAPLRSDKETLDSYESYHRVRVLGFNSEKDHGAEENSQSRHPMLYKCPKSVCSCSFWLVLAVHQHVLFTSTQKWSVVLQHSTVDRGKGIDPKLQRTDLIELPIIKRIRLLFVDLTLTFFPISIVWREWLHSSKWRRLSGTSRICYKFTARVPSGSSRPSFPPGRCGMTDLGWFVYRLAAVLRWVHCIGQIRIQIVCWISHQSEMRGSFHKGTD